MSAPHVDPAGFETLHGAARADACRHLAGCAACRSRLVAESPEAVFALLSLETESDEILDAVSRGVSQRLVESRPSFLEALRERGAPPAAAGWIAAAAVAACALLLFPTGAPGERRDEAPVGAERAGVTLVEPAPAAQLIDLTVGGTQVVMIFDPELEL